MSIRLGSCLSAKCTKPKLQIFVSKVIVNLHFKAQTIWASNWKLNVMRRNLHFYWFLTFGELDETYFTPKYREIFQPLPCFKPRISQTSKRAALNGYFHSFFTPFHLFFFIICHRQIQTWYYSLRPVYTGDCCRGNSMQFLSSLSCIKFQTCWKPLRYRGDKSHWISHLVHACYFKVATLVRQKLHRVAATKIACTGLKSHLSVVNKSGELYRDTFIQIDIRTGPFLKMSCFSDFIFNQTKTMPNRSIYQAGYILVLLVSVADALKYRTPNLPIIAKKYIYAWRKRSLLVY